MANSRRLQALVSSVVITTWLWPIIRSGHVLRIASVNCQNSCTQNLRAIGSGLGETAGQNYADQDDSEMDILPFCLEVGMTDAMCQFKSCFMASSILSRAANDRKSQHGRDLTVARFLMAQMSCQPCTSIADSESQQICDKVRDEQ